MAESAKKTSAKKSASPAKPKAKTGAAKPKTAPNGEFGKAQRTPPSKPKASSPRKASARVSRRNAEIAGLLFVSLGIFCALTLTQSTGAAGARIAGFGFGLFGFVYYLLSLLFIAYGVYTIVMAGKEHRVAKSMMILLIMICTVSLFHLPVVTQLALNKSYFAYLQNSFQHGETLHRGGGLFGAFLTLPMRNLVGVSASYLIFITLLVIEAIVLTNLSLSQAGSAVGQAIRDNIDVIQRRQAERKEREEIPEDEDEWFGGGDYDEDIAPTPPRRQDLNFDQSRENPVARDGDGPTLGATAAAQNPKEAVPEPKAKKRRNPFDFPDFVEGEAQASDALRDDKLGAKIRPIEAMPSSEGRSRYESSDWEGYEGELPASEDPTSYDRWYDVREDLPFDPLQDEAEETSKSDAYTFEVSDDYDQASPPADSLAFFESTGVGRAKPDDGSTLWGQEETSFFHRAPDQKNPRTPQPFDDLLDAERNAGVWPNPADAAEKKTQQTTDRERVLREADARLSPAQAIQAARDRAESTPSKTAPKEKPYAPPPLKCLALPDKRSILRDNPRAKAQKLEETLASFGIAAEVIDVAQGPVITRFELRPAPGVRVNRIANLSDDLALNLAAKSVRIEAPIPGKAAIGIEIPNASVIPVSLRELIEKPEFKQHRSKLAVALGRDIAGKIVVADIAKMPHLLIAGSTGSGKSVCINTILCSFLYHCKPEDVKLILVDPKVVELASFSLIPHLLIPVVTDPKKAASALNWAVHEMVERYNLFAERGARDLARYNAILENDGEQKLPQIVAVIDELADLMMVAPDDVEDAICRIAQMGRAAGIHLIVATQRPSSDIITGLIKANIPSRIAFAVASGTDSRIILDANGAERLLGKGDMLFKPNGSKAFRVQGALVTDAEIESIKDHFQTMYGPRATHFDQKAIEDIEAGQALDPKGKGKNGKSIASDEDGPGFDELLPEAVEMLMQIGHASTSMVQRRHRIGYNRAARMIEEMEQLGIVSAADGSKPRNILIDRGGFERLFGYPPNIAPLGS